MNKTNIPESVISLLQVNGFTLDDFDSEGLYQHNNKFYQEPLATIFSWCKWQEGDEYAIMADEANDVHTAWIELSDEEREFFGVPYTEVDIAGDRYVAGTLLQELPF